MPRVRKVNPEGTVRNRPVRIDNANIGDGVSLAPIADALNRTAGTLDRIDQRDFQVEQRLQRMKEVEQAKTDRLKANQADLSYLTAINETLTTGEDAYFNRQGEVAFSTVADVEGALEAKRVEILESLETEEQKQNFDLRSKTRFQRASIDVNKFAAQEKIRWETDLSKARLAAFNETAALNYTDPEQMFLLKGEVESETQKLFANSSEEVRELALRQNVSDLFSNAINQAIINEDIASAKLLRKSYGEELTTDARAKADRAFREIEKQARAELQAELKARVADDTAAYLQGLLPDKPQTRDDFIRAFGREDGVERYASYRQVQDLGRDLAEVPALTPDEINQLIKDREPRQTGEGFAQSSALYNKFTQGVARIEKAKQDDPIVFLQRYGTVKPGVDTPEAVLAEQQRLGVERPRLLANAQVDAIAASFEIDENGRSNAAETMAKLQADFGDQYDVVYRQLGASKKIPPSALIIGAGVAPSTAAALSSIASVSTKDLKALVSDPETVTRDVANALQNARTTFAFQRRGGPAQYTMIAQETERLAFSYAAQGFDDAGKRAAEEIINAKYDFTSTYRVPKAANVELGAVKSGTENILANLKLEETGIPLIEDQRESFSQEQFERLLTDAYFVTDPEEKGLILYAGEDPLPGPDGKAMRYTWEQLSDRASPGWFSGISDSVSSFFDEASEFLDLAEEVL